jgi:hypothetical protein
LPAKEISDIGKLAWTSYEDNNIYIDIDQTARRTASNDGRGIAATLMWCVTGTHTWLSKICF